MKNLKKIKAIGIAFLLLTISSCSLEPVIDSTITYYPNLEITGDVVTVITKGSAFTDPGATSESNGAQLPVVTTGTVDANTIGVYKLNYSSVNTDGFSATKTRTVIVLSPDPSTINLAGTFRRGANPNVVTRISDRVYKCDNAAGYTAGDSNNLTLTFYNLDDKKVYAPYTTNASATGLSAESSIGTIVNQNSWNWVIYASGFYGTAVRSFTR